MVHSADTLLTPLMALSSPELFYSCRLELKTKVHEVFTITEKGIALELEQKMKYVLAIDLKTVVKVVEVTVVQRGGSS